MNAKDSPKKTYTYTYFWNESSVFVVAINNGDSGFFALVRGTPDEQWQFCVPGSTRWDAYHQNIYYTHHDYEPCPEEICRELPPLPDVPEYRFMKWQDNFPEQQMLCSDFPFLSARISESGSDTVQYWIVLYEDLYESKHGDGSFIYFKGAVYEDETEARTFAKTMNAQGSWPNEEGYTCKLFKIIKEGDEIKVVEGKPASFEHYKIEEVVARINCILNPDNEVQFGEWDESGGYN